MQEITIFSVVLLLMLFGIWSLACIWFGAIIMYRKQSNLPIGNPIDDMIKAAKDAQGYFERDDEEEKNNPSPIPHSDL